MKTQINSVPERELMRSKCSNDIATKLDAFKASNKICLTLPLDHSVVIEMGLNDEDDQNSKGKKSKETNHMNELCVAIPLFCIMMLIIFASIGLLVYFYIKDFV